MAFACVFKVKLRGKVEGCAACGSNPTLTSETLPHFDYAEFTKQPLHDKVGVKPVRYSRRFENLLEGFRRF